LHAPLREKLRQYDRQVRAKAGDNLTLRFPEALAGGDAERGRRIFIENAAVSCQRCHKLDGQGGEVGPPMNGIGSQKTREYLLESIVLPSAQIAEGYQSVILNLIDGRTVSGVLRAKDKEKYTLVTADDKMLTIPADDVESERPDKSAMPDDLHKKLSKRELRDVVEFLASLREPSK
jgi:quinoprotein glucose dehydrogenase